VGLELYEKNYREHVVKNLKRRAKELGLQVIDIQVTSG
jgi:hypothetical protein